MLGAALLAVLVRPDCLARQLHTIRLPSSQRVQYKPAGHSNIKASLVVKLNLSSVLIE